MRLNQNKYRRKQIEAMTVHAQRLFDAGVCDQVVVAPHCWAESGCLAAGPNGLPVVLKAGSQ